MAKWGEIKCPRCEELEAQIRKSALQELSALGQASEAYQAQLAAEAKLAKAVEALQIIEQLNNTHDQWAVAAETLAELAGNK